MDILKMGAELMAQKMGNNAGGSDAIQQAIGGLLADANGDLNLGELVSGLQQGGLGNLVQSWLGDGANEAVSADQLKNAFGADKIGQLASQLGSDEGSVLAGLQDALPQMLDKSSSGGSLLDAVGGLGGVAELAKGLFK